MTIQEAWGRLEHEMRVWRNPMRDHSMNASRNLALVAFQAGAAAAVDDYIKGGVPVRVPEVQAEIEALGGSDHG